MKKKDMLLLVVAAGIFIVAGYIIFTQLAPQGSGGGQKKGVDVEVIGKIPSSMDDSALELIQDQEKVLDFNSPVDLTGLGNKAPFGP
jgi:hypothetical protein